MAVERKCLECGAMIAAFDLGCKSCGKKYKLSEDLLKSYGDLPEPPVGEWIVQERNHKKPKNKFFRGKLIRKKMKYRNFRAFEADYSGSLNINPSKNTYNVAVGFLVLVVFLVIPYFRTELIVDSRILPYSLLGFTSLVTIVAILKSSFYNKLLLVPTLVVKNKEIYRLLTSGFAHVNGTHLLLNGFAIFSFGPPLMQFLIEIYGQGAPLAFIAFYLLSICIADLPDLIRYRNNYSYSSVGASGATSAVVAAASIAVPDMQVTFAFAPGTGDAPSIPGIVYAIGFLVISLYLTFRGREGIAHLAHATGIIFGFIAIAVLSAQMHLNLYGNLIDGFKTGNFTSASSTYNANDSFLIQLNGRGSDIWSENSLEGWKEWGAMKIYSSSDCHIVIFQNQQLAETMFSDWATVGPPGFIAWNVKEKIVLGPNADASCVKTSGKVLGIELYN